MADEPVRIRIWLTDPLYLLRTGEIPAVMAEIILGRAIFEQPDGTKAALPYEGTIWHRTRWAAVNYARSIRHQHLEALRAEVARIEAFDFGARP
ncbi:MULTISPECIES: hypothetical protein [Methylobacterium]|uniref:Uncharacterized protein n=2 Tax=Pseudomonadota TaxID=1224 RepID=A0ABQ4SZ90_9HYPH|nr:MULTISPECIES: hypothetical protein [Methylobacterium]PIU08168.1 MAG: hypothetical protein COT56_02270 [Methylobacterium sp. CG09_land_8_20_14_0_10_71_15]PIU15678.1 MAG: hypothetical protein COT28_03520 [Methylobacterium sp. CG08_land_8_20_14_0_20_71_15]GBU17264.1 hypothetical protein AwMethylo_14790 [Methylobacterium sp.]GJE07825.1 hypothetical protein AOPFMNJM_3157 [Methylobacterium jeotgali]